MTTIKKTYIRGGRATDVQSVTFNKQYWDTRRAISWLRDRGFKSPKVDETETQLRFRQRNPSKYSHYATKSITPTINFILGIRDDAPPRKAKRVVKKTGGRSKVRKSGKA
jgi:hypothetical protein